MEKQEPKKVKQVWNLSQAKLREDEVRKPSWPIASLGLRTAKKTWWPMKGSSLRIAQKWYLYVFERWNIQNHVSRYVQIHTDTTYKINLPLSRYMQFMSVCIRCQKHLDTHRYNLLFLCSCVENTWEKMCMYPIWTIHICQYLKQACVIMPVSVCI